MFKFILLAFLGVLTPEALGEVTPTEQGLPTDIQDSPQIEDAQLEDRRHLSESTERYENAHQETKAHQDVTFFMFLCMLIGQLLKQFANWSGVPYTSLLTVFGILVGIYKDKLGRLEAGISGWAEIDPHLMLLLFLPALVFESAFNSDWHIFKVEIWQVIIMAGPLLLGATYLTAFMMRFVLGY